LSSNFRATVVKVTKTHAHVCAIEAEIQDERQKFDEIFTECQNFSCEIDVEI